MATKFVYLFSEGNGKMRELLGGKGANLAEMTNLGMPVPQACTQYYEDGEQINDEIQAQIMEYISKMEEITGKKFGDLENPLLVSVRSGARASMPGMMDTILNLGLNEDVVEVIAKKSGNPRWAYDCYRRFIQMYSDVVMEVGKKYFEELIDQMKAKRGVTQDVELTAEDLKELAGQFKAEYKSKIGQDFPTDPKEQLMGAIKAVFRSWDNPRANVYRRMNEIPYDWGTAVNVQSMVFGNSGDNSGTGVAFTRNPATGEKKLMGEFLTNAQGEDVVAGVRTPSPISKLHEEMPAVYEQFAAIADRLEKHYKDMQDMEFTIENGKLYMLQTRNGKRTAAAALKVAVDLVDEGMIDEKEAVCRVDPKQLDALLHPTFDAEALKKAQVVGKGLAASPGAACGRVVFTAEEAKNYLINQLAEEVTHESAMKVREIEAQFKEEADTRAKEILSLAIQRCAADHVAEATVSVVPLPNDEMKGRIIGREGRNIRTLETMTGVDLIIDDTPEAITVSCFDPVRREIARIALEKLIQDGRIHPTRIEEMVEKAKREVDAVIKSEGERAIFETNVHGLHPELVKLLGRMRYRTSYGQNVLNHSIEVSHIAGLLAAEIGANVAEAKRAGLLHDLGKSVDHEVEGSHVQIGVELARKYHESENIIHAIQAHHNDVEPRTIVACLVQAADAISAARPGARRENVENYIKRLEMLEEITSSFPGVEKSFAIQAGREVRIMVKPEVISEDQMVLLARDIAKKIEDELEYPGQIKVNMIRETKVIEYAK